VRGVSFVQFALERNTRSAGWSVGSGHRPEAVSNTSQAPGHSDQKLVEFLALIDGADTVELKLTVPTKTGPPP